MSFSPIPSLTGIRDSPLRRVLEAVKINLEILIAQRGSGEDKAVIQGELDTTLTDYYTKGQTNSLLNSKADKVPDATEDNFASLDTEGNLKDSGKSPADFADVNHTHDDRYYTETEIDTALAGKSDVGHAHDDRYYTESEVDTLLESKASKEEAKKIAIKYSLVLG
jgi:hypothetical protein